MADDHEMTLKMKILANARQARLELKKMGGSVKSVMGAGLFAGAFGAARGINMAFRGMGKMAGWAVDQFKRLVKIGGVAATGMGVLGFLAVRSASKFEDLQSRLEGVMGSAKKARQAFAQSKGYFGKSPFFLEDIVDARILLESIGVKGSGAIRALGNAAAIIKRPLADVAAIVAGMEAEPLRRLGISLKREGDNGYFEFLDKTGKKQKMVVQGIDEMRKALLKIFNIKYGGATNKLMEGLSAKWDMLTGKLKLAFGNLGEGLLPAAKKFIDFLNEKLDVLIDGKKFIEWGKKIGAILESAVERVMAVIDTIPAVAEGIKQTMKNAPENFVRLMGQAGMALGDLLFSSIVGALKLLPDIARAAGAILWEAFGRQIMQLPGFRGKAQGMAKEKWAGMSLDQKKAFAKSYYGYEEDYRDVWTNIQSPRKQDHDMVAALATWGAEGNTNEAIGSLIERGKRDAALFGEAFSETAQKVVDAASGAIGVDIAGEYQKNREENELGTWVRLTPKYENVDNTMTPQWKGKYGVSKMKPGAYGDHKDGYARGKGIQVFVDKLDVVANDVEKAVREVIRKSAGPAMAPAAGT